MKKVYGSYLNNTSARGAVDELFQQGYTRDEIKVISNSDLSKDLSYMEADHDIDDRSLWEKIKDAFTFDKYDDEYWDKDLDDVEERKLLEEYRTNLQDGEVIILIADKRKNEFNEDLNDYNEDKNNTEYPRKEFDVDSTIYDSAIEKMKCNSLKNRDTKDSKDAIRKKLNDKDKGI